jgi:hypothetical protein
MSDVISSQLSFPNTKAPELIIFDKDKPFKAKAYFEKLIKFITEFEKGLEDNQEVGAKLVTFGESITIHIDDISYSNPRLIIFHGQDIHGQKVQLIQHVNQISILLIVVKRIDSERPRIGYILSEKTKQENQE